MFISALLLFLSGCPDPTTASDLGNPGPGGAPPGAADGPNLGGEGAGMGPPPAPGQFNVGAEGGVAISGSLVYSGSEEGQVRLDFLRTEGDSPPHLLHVEKLNSVGEFELRVPANTGPVTIVAFVDVDDDGPSSSDPAGMIQIAIEEAAISSLQIDLSDSPDLGALTPGNEPPPEAAEAGSAPEQPEVIPVKAPDEQDDVETKAPTGTAETPPSETQATEAAATEAVITE